MEKTEKKPTPQSRWDKKNGYIAKSFRMYQSLADEFKEACERNGEAQATVIQRLMREYIDQNK